jgi:hypothetical protein
MSIQWRFFLIWYVKFTPSEPLSYRKCSIRQNYGRRTLVTFLLLLPVDELLDHSTPFGELNGVPGEEIIPEALLVPRALRAGGHTSRSSAAAELPMPISPAEKDARDADFRGDEFLAIQGSKLCAIARIRGTDYSERSCRPIQAQNGEKWPESRTKSKLAEFP